MKPLLRIGPLRVFASDNGRSSVALRRRKPTRGKHDRPLIEIFYAHWANGETMPIAVPVAGATQDDCKYIREWLHAVRTRGHSVDAFIPRDEPAER